MIGKPRVGDVGVLNSFERSIALRLDKLIQEDEKETGRMRNVTVDKNQTRSEGFVNGFGAELVYCRMANVYPDLKVHGKSKPFDCVVNGYTVDVKQTTHDTGRMAIYPKLKDNDVDIYVLMTGDFFDKDNPCRYFYRGWCFKKEIILEENITNLGYPNDKPYCLFQQHLHKEDIPS